MVGRGGRWKTSIKASELSTAVDTIVHITNSSILSFSLEVMTNYHLEEMRRDMGPFDWYRRWTIVFAVGSLPRSFRFLFPFLHTHLLALVSFHLQWLISVTLLWSTIIEQQKLLITMPGTELIFSEC